MEKRAFLAVLLSLAVLILYQSWVSRQYGVPPPPQQEIEKEQRIAPTPEPPRQVAQTKARPQPLGAQAAVKEVTVETDKYIAVFTTRGARLKSFRLRQYRASVDKESPLFDLVSSDREIPLPLGIQIKDPAPFSDEGLVYEITGTSLNLRGDARGILSFHGQTPSGISITKKFTFVGSTYVLAPQATTAQKRTPSSKGSWPSMKINSFGKQERIWSMGRS
jgi:YidC/Oxa1 family membrane protein insertase